MVEQDGRTSAYFTSGPVAVRVKGRWERIDEQDWAETWKAGLEPVRVGELVVTPPWHATGDPAEVVIEPAQAFGTGHHETTAGCLATLQQLRLQGARVLDVGCGSGVLGIAAARLGAAIVVAVDTDPLAVEAARSNAASNGVEIDVRDGSVWAAEGAFDVVIANLDTSTLVALAATLAARLATAGTLVASGVSTERVGEPLAAFTAAGLQVDVRTGAEWAVLQARHLKAPGGMPPGP